MDDETIQYLEAGAYFIAIIIGFEYLIKEYYKNCCCY